MDWYAEREVLRQWRSSCKDMETKSMTVKTEKKTKERLGENLGRGSMEDELGADAGKRDDGAGEGLEGVAAHGELHGSSGVERKKEA